MLCKVINLVKMRYISLILITVIVFSIYIYQHNKPVDERVTLGGGFTLVNQNGDSFSNNDIVTPYMLVFFGFTNCHMVCPTGMYNISEALDSLSLNELNEITPVFITLDPARDNPEVVKDFLTSFHDKFVGLTGDAEVLKAVEKQYGVFTQKEDADADNDYQVNHSAYIYFTDNDGNYISHSFYNASKEDIRRFIETNLK